MNRGCYPTDTSPDDDYFFIAHYSMILTGWAASSLDSGFLSGKEKKETMVFQTIQKPALRLFRSEYSDLRQ
jgi:hypothetical protein